MSKGDNFKSILGYINTLPVFSDHEHHMPDDFFKGEVTLDKLLRDTYVSWTGFSPYGTYESRKELLDNVSFNSYYYWFEKGLQAVHGIDEAITLESWERISGKVAEAYQKDPDFHWKALRDNGYERLIQDAHWNPGDDNGHGEIFLPAFRIDMFMHGYHGEESFPPENLKAWTRYGFEGGSFDDFVENMTVYIREKHRQGKVVAFKCAEAYLRPISFLPDDEEAARQAFGIHPDKITDEQKYLFGNYIFNRCCELAAELDVPFQIHTGLARLSGSQPMKLEPVIQRHPQTRFVLFHSGFPWTHEISGLAHNNRNVFPSLTWTATICTSAAIRALHDYIDVTPSINRITWGSDCWVPEESVGAQLAWRFIVATVLAERLDDGRLTASGAETLARKLMYENGRRIYLKG